MKKSLASLILILSFSQPAFATWNHAIFGFNDPYYKTLKKFTRKGTGLALGYLDTKYIWFATYKSEVFRQAFAEFYQKNYPVGQEGLAQSLAAPWINVSPNPQFFVALYARDVHLEQLGNEESLWDLSLQKGSQVYKPISVEPLELTSFEVRFFPYLERWYSLYRVTFPPESSSTTEPPFSLVLNSVAGHSELKFK